MNRRIPVAGLGAAALLGAALIVPAGAQASTAEINVVHGLPGGGAVDVCIEATNVSDGLAEGARATLEDPLEAGTYGITVAEDAPENDCATPVVTGSFDVVDGQASLDVVAHLDTDGNPVVSSFENNVAMTANGEGRITLRHAADIDPVDANVDDQQFADALPNGDEVSDAFTAEDHVLTIYPDGVTDTPLVSAETIALAAGTEEVRYLVGGDAEPQVLAFTREVGEEPAPPDEPATGDRISGDFREDTAVAISQTVYPDGAPVVYIADRSEFADALAAKSLQDGPVLLNATCGGYSAERDADGDLLYDANAEEIQRLQPDRVIALGGEAAVCADVLDAAVDAANAEDAS